ncbi:MULTISPECIES: hypothetical protein [pseudomallei group]|uniref:hypothetical protein n=1 Tax=pseudomallei group TaxID=111527 RepID=UPI000F4EDBD7|nr:MULTISPECIES: hypothetical protein [pseudomallei group]MCZ2897869.1 hypothetical protein [Burkholderia thailandensis]RSK63319.1 hypothetical protein DF122_18610 [Burkholderia pseudomallei]TGB35628.1 hypothetical protein C6946_00310 [Burkholderia thailandensis]TXD04379.1 hypothetical protein FTI75_12110 [Burkholderia pseudomallei]
MNKTTKPASEGPKRETDNVYELPTIRRRTRQAAIRAFLRDLVARHDRSPAVAAAAVLLREDGTIAISAKGVDADTAEDVLAGAHQLAERIEYARNQRSHRLARQRGTASILATATIGIAAAAYLNTSAWLDAALVLTCHAATLLLTPRNSR